MFFAPKALFVWLPNTHEVSEKRCSLYNVYYAVLGSGRGMCQQIRYHRKILGGVSTLKGIQKNLWASGHRGWVNQVHFRAQKQQNGRFCDHLEIADLPVLQPWDRSGVYNESILAGLECHRTIGAVQTRIPEIVNRDSRNFLYSFSFGELDYAKLCSWFQRPSGPPCPAGLVLVWFWYHSKQ